MATEVPVPDVEVPADEPVEEAAPADVVVPPNAAAAITAEGVVQHLDVDPNDPRNVPQVGLLPLTTDADQQGPAPAAE